MITANGRAAILTVPAGRLYRPRAAASLRADLGGRAMFHHVVMMRFTAAADAAFHERVQDYVRRIRREVPDVLAYHAGRNLADRAKGFDWAVLGTFTTSAAHDAYQVSPVHQEMKTFMAPFIADIVVCDMSVE